MQATSTNAATVDTASAKRNAKRNAKPAATETATPATAENEAPLAPVAAAPVVAVEPVAPSAPAIDYAAHRAAVAAAAAVFYSGASLPFKPVFAKLSDFNPTNAKKPSARTGALVAMLLAYANDGAIAPDGTFTRGAFTATGTDGKPYAAMPESGALGNIAGRCVSHVSGPIGGKQARDGIFRLDFAACRTELQQIGDALAKPALALLDKLAPIAA